MKRLFLIDAYALIFRFYYGFMSNPMRNSEGFNTSIVFGFAKFLRDLLRREKPDLLGVAFDPPGGSFRRRLFPDYKAHRGATPEDIIASTPYVKRLIEAMCIPILEVEDFEADDVIGTLSAKGEAAGYEVFMVTPDKDYGQLVTDNCHLYRHKGDEITITDKAAIKEKYGIDDPMLVRDILAIWGDASDNIPGVVGIGEKGACKLVCEWGCVENILENVGSIKGKQGEKLAASVDALRLSKELTTIRLDVPIEFCEEHLMVCEPKVEELKELFREMNFRGLYSELERGFFFDGEGVAKPSDDSDTPVVAAFDSPIDTPAPVGAQGDLFSGFVSSASVVSSSSSEESENSNSQEQLYRTIADVGVKYHLVNSVDSLREVVAKVGAASEFCFDTETTGVDPYSSKLVGISFAIESGEAWYVDVHSVSNDSKSLEEYKSILRPLFESESVAKIGQNIKFDLVVLRQFGIEVAGRLIDTMLLSYLLDAESRHGMTALAQRHLNYSPIEIETLIGKGAKQLTMAVASEYNLDKVVEYACEDADVTLQLKHILYDKVEKQGLLKLYDMVEEPMIRVLADMEMAGVSIDSDALGRYGMELRKRLDEVAKSIRDEAEEPQLNVNSSVQLGDVLFAKMKIAEKPKKTKTGRFSTDEEYLQSFAGKHVIIDNILEYRKLNKLLTTYVEALPLLVNPSTGRIHSTYNQAVTATGRLSSTNPNLQNIPIRDEDGRPIRAAFIAADSDREIFSADYSQVELRIMAHFAQDKSLIEAFEKGIDVHTATAARLFHKSVDDVTADDRRKAKTANFGIIYGISAFGLAQRLDISRTEAKGIVDGYFESYPGVKSYMERVMAEARDTGYVETLLGRRRYLKDIVSMNATVRSMAERNAINAPIQGTAADIMKLAMIGVWREFKAQGVKSQMIMQVHDEVVIEVLKSEIELVDRIVKEQMQGAADLSVELLVESGFGKSWLDAH
ncbi:MAG: DNA polymerase I [Rikenellaceae bacterium]